MTLISRLFGRASRRAPATPARPAGLRLEALEKREVLSGAAYLTNGWLVIVGYNYPNPNNTAVVSSTLYAGAPAYAVSLDGKVSYFKAAGVRGGTFYGYQGNDYFANLTGLPFYAFGHEGNDTLIGGSGSDYQLNGGLGNDWILGMAGNDGLNGSDGNDHLYGGSGNDIMTGQAGNDWVQGDSGDDMLFGEGGSDTLSGGYGNDYLTGGNDGLYDALYGGPGGDTFVNDWYFGTFGYANRDKPRDYKGYYGALVDYSDAMVG